jgi:hypothetical protein
VWRTNPPSLFRKRSGYESRLPCPLSGGHERIGRIDLWLGFNAKLAVKRDEDLTKALDGLLRLPYVNNAEAVVALSRSVNKQAFDRPVGRRLQAALAAYPADDLLVVLPCHSGALMNENDRHAYLLALWIRTERVLQTEGEQTEPAAALPQAFRLLPLIDPADEQRNGRDYADGKRLSADGREARRPKARLKRRIANRRVETEGDRGMRKTAMVFGLVALLSAASLTACLHEDEEANREASCTIGVAALGFAIEAATRGRENFTQVNEFVSSRIGGDALSTGCVLLVESLINRSRQTTSFDLNLSSTTLFRQVDGATLVQCLGYLSDVDRTRCYSGEIPPP